MISIQPIGYERRFHPALGHDVALGIMGDTLFRRAAGGLHWPTIGQPGFAILLVEDLQRDDVTHLHHKRIFEEYSNNSLHSLLQWCEMRGVNSPPEIPILWYVDTTKRPSMQGVSDLNKNMRLQGRSNQVNIAGPPWIDFRVQERDGFYDQLIRQYLSVDAITFPPDSRLPGDLDLVMDKLSGPVLALAYVLAAMDTWPYVGKIQE